jgi:hypothetical protein
MTDGGNTAFTVTLWPAFAAYCDRIPGVNERTLWYARDNDPLEVRPEVLPDMVTMLDVGDSTFPGVTGSVLLPGPTASQFHFLAGPLPYSNVWDTGEDIRTSLSEPFDPTGYGDDYAAGVVARIQSVQSHDDDGNSVPANIATGVNIAVDLFFGRTSLSVPLDYVERPGLPHLYIAADHERFQDAPGTPSRSTYEVDGVPYPRWIFKNVPITAGRVYHFLAFSGAESNPLHFSNIWTLAAEPQPYVPPTPSPPACISR